MAHWALNKWNENYTLMHKTEDVMSSLIYLNLTTEANEQNWIKQSSTEIKQKLRKNKLATEQC